MADVLLELLTEEIPARFQVAAESAFLDAITTGLKDNGLSFDTATSLSTPRRLAVIISGLPAEQPDTITERKGPHVNAPEHALNGFLKSVGLPKNALTVQDTPKGQVYFAVVEKKGQKTIHILPEIINTAIKHIAWAKSMRFSDYSFRFVRPLQRIIAVFDTTLIKGHLPLGNNNFLPYTDKTLGHRFMSTGEFTVNARSYSSALADAHVIAHRQMRKQHITNGLNNKASKLGISLIYDIGLLEEVTGLVENPVVLIGDIPQKFMSLPREVLITSLREHQKFFVFENTDGSLAPYFATVANIYASDGGHAITQGNQKVLHARLSDSVFFYNNDIQNWTEYTNNTALAGMKFHAKLGSVKSRIDRIRYMAKTVAELLKYDDPTRDKVDTSARICKSDLVSEMVFEFPELQGIMGAYYSANAGDDRQIANAIKEHYKPKGATDAVPTDAVAIAVAIAEKMDTLCGFWLIDEKPTGSKDPYALRRCALGVLRIVLENALPLNIMQVADAGFKIYSEINVTTDNITYVRKDLEIFLIDRLKHALKSEGIRHDYIDSVLSGGLDATIVDKVQLARVMGENACTVSAIKSAYIRTGNIVAKAENFNAVGVNTDIFVDDLETQLYTAVVGAGKDIKDAKKTNDFKRMMDILSHLNPPLNAFFDGVMVNVEAAEIRNNRLNILSAVMQTVNQITNFEYIKK